jgi:hypothetical protein
MDHPKEGIEMHHANGRLLVLAGLMIVGNRSPVVIAQQALPLLAQRPAMTPPGVVADGLFPANPVDSAFPAVPPAGTCTCGAAAG